MTCPICLEEMKKEYITICNHKYHEDCLDTWLETKNTCPLCRTKLKNVWSTQDEIEWVEGWRIMAETMIIIVDSENSVII